MALTVDITQRADCEKLVAETVRHYGSLDVMVINASSNRHGPALELSEEFWNECIAIELTGHFNCAQAAGAWGAPYRRCRLTT